MVATVFCLLILQKYINLKTEKTEIKIYTLCLYLYLYTLCLQNVFIYLYFKRFYNE